MRQEPSAEALTPPAGADSGVARQLKDLRGLRWGRARSPTEHHRLAAAVTGGIEAKPWGVREFTIMDPDNNQLRFGQETD